jgi:hypothetical protein
MRAFLRSQYRQLLEIFGAELTDDVSLIGLDVTREPSRLRNRRFAPVLAALLLGALFVVALRVDLLRMRYDKAEVLAHERSLIAVHHELLVDKQKLRDPARLAVEAEKIGLRRPERIIDWPASTDETAPTKHASTVRMGAQYP